jgi:high frequency lysogenization protein
VEHSLKNQVIALAGVAQAMELVKQIARTGRNDEMALKSAVLSIFMIDADGILEVYGGLPNLVLGLKALKRQLSEPRQVDPETARYASTLIYLEPLLSQNGGMIEVITSAIQEARGVWERSTERLDPEVFRILAAAYQQTVSTLKPRIMVAGEQRQLSDPQNANQIRTLLLAGIRSARLWRQAGGSKWRVLFLRSRMQRIVDELLDEAGRISRSEHI